MLALYLVTLSGTLLMYQGQEIGMVGDLFDSRK